MKKMSKNDNPHAIRLFNSLLKHTDEQNAERIISKIPLSKSADFYKKFEWAYDVCDCLQNEFDEEMIKKVRRDCSCGPETGKIDKIKRLYEKSSNFDDFTTKFNALNQGFKIEHEGNTLFLIYPQCYCSCVKRVPQSLPKLWCYCTLGYTKKMFEEILSSSVDVELLESVKTGSSRCVIKIFFN